MDGSRTVKDLVVAHFITHKTFAYGRIGALVDELKENGFLQDKPIKILEQVTQQLATRNWQYRWRKLAYSFIEHIFPISGIDRYITAIYKWGGRIFFIPIIQLLMLIIALAGLYPFRLLLTAPDNFPVVSSKNGSYFI